MEFPYKVPNHDITFNSVAAPHWGDADHLCIHCTLEIEGLGEVPYTASSNDSEQHGRDLFTFLAEGGAGPVVAFPTATKAQSLTAIAARRYEAEVSGVVFGGMRIDSGRDSQGLITGATLASVLDPSYICNWKTPEGFVELNAAMLAAVSQAVRTHVQACFDRERVLGEAVDAGTFTKEMLEEGWPTYE